MRDVFEVKRERIRADLANAREKASQWQARARDFERQLTELENTEILRMVHDVASSPEELRGLLDLGRGDADGNGLLPLAAVISQGGARQGQRHHQTQQGAKNTLKFTLQIVSDLLWVSQIFLGRFLRRPDQVQQAPQLLSAVSWSGPASTTTGG